MALKRGRLSAASPEPLPPAWEIRVEVFIFFLIVVLNFSLISTSAERKGRMSDGIHRAIYTIPWEMWAVPTLIGA